MRQLNTHRTRKAPRPRFETLEDRCVPSRSGFGFEAIEYLGNPDPDGATYETYFASTDVNNRGQVIFGAFTSLGGEGIYIRDKDGDTRTLARFGDPAPGGNTFGSVWTAMAINEHGDGAFNFLLNEEVPPLPLGTDFGVFRYSDAKDQVSAVALPDVTPVPGGEPGDTFQGAFLGVDINNKADIVFGAIIPTDEGIEGDLGMGVFLSKKNGQLVSVVSPGDPAPGGSTFDFAENPSINDRGDVAFGGHIASDPVIDFGVPQTTRIFAAESVFLKKANGQIVTIARQGQPVPASAGGGTYRLAFGPVVNNKGQVVFIGDTTPAPGFAEDLGVFFWDDGKTVAVARPGDEMPGGGVLVNASFFITTYDLNDKGEVVFSGSLDTDDDGSIDASGVYLWSKGKLTLVAHTGTDMGEVGTLVQLYPPDFIGGFGGDGDPYTWPGVALNDRGQVVFSGTVENDEGELEGPMIVATPGGGHRGHGHGHDAFFAALGEAFGDDGGEWWLGRRGRGRR